MCGLIVFAGRPGADVPRAALQRALVHMERRGPDGQGLFCAQGIGMGHRRLAIIDLSDRATQPMTSACGRYVIVFNGEIYNYKALRMELLAAGASLRTLSDTEVVLELFAQQGEQMLLRLHGMFAFAIWDTREERVFMARDPYGIKPMYFGVCAYGVFIASQVKTLLATGLISREPDATGQAGYWMLGSVPEPSTWFRDIRALPSGHCAWVIQGELQPSRCWFDIGEAWRAAARRSVRVAEQDVRFAVHTALRESVARHMVADVPVGVFLSGGIDSGALTGLMCDAGATNLLAVTLSFSEFEGRHDDEAPAAAKLAAQYGVKHYLRRVGRKEFFDDLPRILNAMDQPSIDGINTWYASKAVAECGLKVVVSGVGGDELFQGYSSFKTLPRLVAAWKVARHTPGAETLARCVTNWQARRSGNKRWGHATGWAEDIRGAWWLRRSVHSPEDLSVLMEPELATEALRAFSVNTWVSRATGELPQDMRLALGQIESMTYLRNQLLRDSDWASMDHSIELRTPLVDGHLLESLSPWLSSFSHFEHKSLLSSAPRAGFPPDIARRRKSGFGIPVEQWLALGGGYARNSWQNEVAATYGSQS